MKGVYGGNKNYKQIGEKLEMQDEYADLFEAAFSTQDLNDDGEIDVKEMVAQIAYTDKDKDGFIDGKASYEDTMFTSWQNPGIKESLKGIYNYLFS